MSTLRRSAHGAVVTTLLALVVALLVAPTSPTGTATAAAGPRIMFYGDSVMQQTSGDVTWRCRIWSHLTRNGVAADLVGPRDDVFGWRTGSFGSQQYAGPACDRDHASVWGMTFLEPSFGLASTAAAESADVVVAYIGQNDLLRDLATIPTLVEHMRSEILRARQLRPGIDVVLVRDGEEWLGHGIADHNTALAAMAQQLDTSSARVVLSADPGLDRVRDTIDDNHVTSSGEVRLAAVVADALAAIGYGPRWPRPLAAVAQGPGFAPVPTLTAAERSLTVTWTPEEYADRQRVAYRDLTAGTATAYSGASSGSSWTTTAAPGHTYELRMQPVKGRHVGGTLSAARTVRVPARPAAVTRLGTARRASCRTYVSWRAAPFATGYAVQLRDTSRAGSAWMAAHAGRLTRTSTTTGTLSRRHRYAVRVRSYGPLTGATTASRYFTSC